MKVQDELIQVERVLRTALAVVRRTMDAGTTRKVCKTEREALLFLNAHAGVDSDTAGRLARKIVNGANTSTVLPATKWQPKRTIESRKRGDGWEVIIRGQDSGLNFYRAAGHNKSYGLGRK